MDCERFRLLLEAGGFEGAELDAGQKTELRLHLEDCDGCARRFGKVRRFEGRVAKAMRSVPIPVGLKDRIQDNLSARSRRRVRRQAARYMALAASLMLAIGLGFGWNVRKPLPNEPETVEYKQPKLEIEAWKESLEVDFAPPVKFNFELLKSSGEAEYLPGRVAKTFILVNPRNNASAQVFMVRSDALIEEWRNPPAGRVTKVEVLRDLNRPADWVYVVIYSGSSINAFLEGPMDI